MKTILVLLMGILLLSGCESPTIRKSDLPIEVVKLKESKNYDTLLVIKTEDKSFLFERDGEYIGAINKESHEGAAFALGLIVCVIIVVLFIAAIKD